MFKKNLTNTWNNGLRKKLQYSDRSKQRENITLNIFKTKTRVCNAIAENTIVYRTHIQNKHCEIKLEMSDIYSTFIGVYLFDNCENQSVYCISWSILSTMYRVCILYGNGSSIKHY